MAEIVPMIQEAKQNQFIVQYDGTFNQIAKLTTIEMTAINLTHVEAAQVIAKRTKNQEQLILLQEWDKRLQRHLGRFLQEMPKHKGGNPNLVSPSTGIREIPVSPVMKLSELGISKVQSSHAQQLARMPEQEFELNIIAPIKEKRTELELANQRGFEATIIAPKTVKEKAAQQRLEKLEQLTNELQVLASGLAKSDRGFTHFKNILKELGSISPNEISYKMRSYLDSIKVSLEGLATILTMMDDSEILNSKDMKGITING